MSVIFLQWLLFYERGQHQQHHDVVDPSSTLRRSSSWSDLQNDAARSPSPEVIPPSITIVPPSPATSDPDSVFDDDDTTQVQYTCMPAHLHTYIPAYLYTCIHVYLYYLHTCIPAYLYACIPVYPYFSFSCKLSKHFRF